MKLFGNGSHLIDAICYFADSAPEWVMAELEPGFEDYTEYRGDGGHVPETEPGANAYIHFENGVKGFYAGGSKNTHNHKYVAEIVGASGRIFLGGSDEGVLYVQEQDPEPITAPAWPVVGIPAAVSELIDVVADGGELVPGRKGSLHTASWRERRRQTSIHLAPLPEGWEQRQDELCKQLFCTDSEGEDPDDDEVAAARAREEAERCGTFAWAPESTSSPPEKKKRDLSELSQN